MFNGSCCDRSLFNSGLYRKNSLDNSNIGYFDRLDHVPCVIQELVFILIPERIINCYSSNYRAFINRIFI